MTVKYKTKMRIKDIYGRLFLLPAICILLSNCTQGELFEHDSTKDSCIIISCAGVTEMATRAIINNKLAGTEAEHAEMSVWIESANEKYNAENIKWSHNGKNWISATPVLFQGANKQQICAIYPYSVNADMENGITIKAEAQTDYLIAKKTNIGQNPVNLTMTHALAKLVLQPTFGNEMEGIGIKSVEVQNMYASGTLKITDNTWSSLGEKNKTLAMTDNEVLVIPMSNCTSFPLVITMENGRKFKADIPLSNNGNALEAGIKYTIKLQIGANNVKSCAVTALVM